MVDMKDRIKAVNRRNEILIRFKSLHKMLFEAGADLANANADLARIDERIKIQEVPIAGTEEEE